MRFTASVVALTLLGVFTAKGVRINIVGGSEVAKRVSYMAIIPRVEKSHEMCGAVLIAPRYLLTAGHCLHPDIAVVTIGGLLSSGKDGDHHRVQNQFFHPKYDKHALTFDVGVIELSFRSKMAPVRIDWGHDWAVAGADTWASGFGVTEYDKNSMKIAPALKEVRLPIWTDEECSAVLGSALEGSVLCAGNKSVAVNHMCFFDMGGPLVVKTGGSDVLVGIAASTSDCGESGMPNFFSNVQTSRAFIAPFLTAEANEDPLTDEPRPTKPPLIEAVTSMQ